MLLLQQDKRKIYQIPIEKIMPNPSQPRKAFNEDELVNLSESIKQNGLLQPITVRKSSVGYEIIAGERRYRACKMANMKTIPCILNECDEMQAAVYAILENLQRQDLQIFEEAEGLQHLLQAWNITQEEAAKRLGKSQSALANKLRLLKLTDEERKKITDAGLTERHARALLRIADTNQREKILEAIIEQNLNVKQTDKLVESKLNRPIKKNSKSKRMFIAKDIRIFMNTIDHAVNLMQEAGIHAQEEHTETTEYMEFVIRIPKQSAGANVKESKTRSA